MKKIFTLFIVVLLASSLKSFAQGNLQFNQVKSESVVLSANTSTPTITVPVGKVWKIETMGTNNVTAGYIKYAINGVAYSLTLGGQMAGGSIIWLKAGDTFSMSNNTSNINNIGVYYSILEFNIVP